MPVLERRIIGFLCNWCSYGGADAAGVARYTQPTDIRIVRLPCTGRMNPAFVVKALLSGADGVLVSGCHPRDCHYSEGNFYARRRLETLKRFLPVLGIDPARFAYTWVSAAEGRRWQEVVTAFTATIHELPPIPRLADDTGLDDFLRELAAMPHPACPDHAQAANAASTAASGAPSTPASPTASPANAPGHPAAAPL